jgi:signal transduction histidine kinase
MARRSIGGPLAIGIISMVLVLALSVGWQVLVWRRGSQITEGLSPLDVVLFVLGTLFFAVVMFGLVWLSVKLVLEVRMNQSQRAFLDAVTHELRTPLSSFRLGLETLGRHELEPPQRAEFLRRMGEDLDRLEQTVAQVLAAARSEETPRSQASSGSVELLELLAEGIDEVRERHGLAEGAVMLGKSRPLRVRGDRAELVELKDGRIRVEISDRGIGIPKQELHRIFQRFYRAGRDVQRQVSGLGLGLFVVRALLRKQGAHIVALSEGAGQGSRFVVTLRPARVGGGT